MNNRLVKWLMAPSKLPNAPPLWVVILVCGVIYNAIDRNWWVALGSLVLVLVIKIPCITQEKIDKLIFPSMRNK